MARGCGRSNSAGTLPPPHTVFAADGEGYALDVRLVTENEMQGYVSPYRADYARDPAEDASPRWPLKA